MKSHIQNFLKQVVSIMTCFFAFFLIWIISIPLVRHFYKSVPSYLRWILLAVLVLTLATTGMAFSVWFALLPALALEAHILVGFAWQKGMPIVKQMQKTVLLLLMMLLHIGIALALKYFLPEIWEQEITVWVNRIAEYIQSTASEQNAEAHLNRWKALSNYIPALYFTAFISAYLISFVGTAVLNKIEVPSVYFWMILSSFALAFIDLKGLKITVPPSVILVAKNLFFPLCSLYFFQGVAVLNSLFDKIKIARFWRNMWYILIILYMPVGLVLLGVAEYLFEYREKYKEERKGLE